MTDKEIEKLAREYAEGQTPSPIQQSRLAEDTAHVIRFILRTHCIVSKDAPLAERLTDAEKKKIIGFYNGETFGELDFIELISTRRILTNLFGSELFKDDDNE